MKLANKNALVTGATGGLGREIAIALSNNGCKVFITGRNKNSLETLSENLGSKCLGYLACDLELESEIEVLASAATRAARFDSGIIDILINSAGIFPVANVSDTTF